MRHTYILVVIRCPELEERERERDILIDCRIVLCLTEHRPIVIDIIHRDEDGCRGNERTAAEGVVSSDSECVVSGCLAIQLLLQVQ